MSTGTLAITCIDQFGRPVAGDVITAVEPSTISGTWSFAPWTYQTSSSKPASGGYTDNGDGTYTYPVPPLDGWELTSPPSGSYTIRAWFTGTMPPPSVVESTDGSGYWTWSATVETFAPGSITGTIYKMPLTGMWTPGDAAKVPSPPPPQMGVSSGMDGQWTEVDSATQNADGTWTWHGTWVGTYVVQ